jgi:hypothetical protein
MREKEMIAAKARKGTPATLKNQNIPVAKAKVFEACDEGKEYPPAPGHDILDDPPHPVAQAEGEKRKSNREDQPGPVFRQKQKKEQRKDEWGMPCHEYHDRIEKGIVQRAVDEREDGVIKLLEHGYRTTTYSLILCLRISSRNFMNCDSDFS